MIDRARAALARRAALAAVAARRSRPLPDPVERRTLLLVLPADEDAQRSAWRLVDRLALDDRQLTPVVMGDQVAYAPDRFAGRVETVGDGERDWRRLPRRATAERLWAQNPDVALDLVDGDLAAAFLVGASPAAVRIGRHRPEAERFYDLMVAGDPDDPAAAVGRLLAQLDPPVLAFDARAHPA